MEFKNLFLPEIWYPYGEFFGHEHVSEPNTAEQTSLESSEKK